MFTLGNYKLPTKLSNCLVYLSFTQAKESQYPYDKIWILNVIIKKILHIFDLSLLIRHYYSIIIIKKHVAQVIITFLSGNAKHKVDSIDAHLYKSNHSRRENLTASSQKSLTNCKTLYILESALSITFLVP